MKPKAGPTTLSMILNEDRVKTEVFDTSSAGINAWATAVRLMPGCDVYFLPGYAAACQVSGEGRALAFFAVDKEKCGLEVLMIRDLAQLDFLTDEQRKQSDAASPYGYGGPLFNDQALADPRFIESFFAELSGWCRENGIISRFIRYHPLLENHLIAAGDIKVSKRQPTIYIDLTAPGDLQQCFSCSARRHVKRARDAGLSFAQLDGADRLERFRHLYEKTMQRKQAAENYYFTERYYADLAKGLGGGLQIYAAYHKERLAAAVIFLIEGIRAHYHLGASDKELLKMRPNNFLFYRAAQALREQGCKTLHLGGGLSGRDSLFRFKRSLSSCEARFYTGRQIIDHDAYQDLVRSWREHAGITEESRFFPEYRTPSPSESEAEDE